MKKENANKFEKSLGGAITTIALAVTSLNVNSACLYMAHQPKMPETAKSLRKF